MSPIDWAYMDLNQRCLLDMNEFEMLSDFG